ncbi:unnamed protein product [Trifolium pratense]|uniref:Uncharacterized protein n=1 Tax=Trifolium pratense TaxID=57577 RepID=A0ACB0L059_TRIPR|nr:unnamed protein product [Trifolium pratense]
MQWSSKFLLYIRISSKYTTTNLPKISLKTWFISLMKVLGALVSPNDITNHSYKPYFVLKAVFHSSVKRKTQTIDH